MITKEAQTTPYVTARSGASSYNGLLGQGIDYYKPTMSQLAFERHGEAEVTFTLKNRGNSRLADYVSVEELQARLDAIKLRGWTTEEIEYLASIRSQSIGNVFSQDYLDYLVSTPLPNVHVYFNANIDDLSVESTGSWPVVTFWETVVMSQINELYFESFVAAHDIDPKELYEEGDRRLSEKIEILQKNPGIKISDFGTRRRFSYTWHKHIVERLKAECPENFVGTSNIDFARELGLRAIGTFAHELPMIYAGLADAGNQDVRSSHNKMLLDWYEKYGQEYSISLTDTFGSNFFFESITKEQVKSWKGIRHDSGDPIAFGEQLISFYISLGINPTTKTIVFSDGLDMKQILKLYEHFNGRINMTFGWGTTLTNDLGLKPLNIVMKATSVNGAETVKLSDDSGKHSGSSKKVNEYTKIFKEKIL